MTSSSSVLFASSSSGDAPVPTDREVASLRDGERFSLRGGFDETTAEVAALAITAEATFRGSRYSREGKGPLQHRYEVTLFMDGRELSLPFFTGDGWAVAPTAKDVLSTLASDTQFVDFGGRAEFLKTMEEAGESAWAAKRAWATHKELVETFRSWAREHFATIMQAEPLF